MTRTKKPSAREVALEVLLRIDEHQSYSNLELKHMLEHTHLIGPDVGLVTELVYGTIQRRSTLDFVITKFVKGGPKKLQNWVLQLLRMSMYQIHYLDRIPPHAAVNEAVEIAKRKGHQGISSLVNGVLRNVLRQPQVWEEKPSDVVKEIALVESHPEWLVKRWIKQYGAEITREICKSNNQAPTPTIRANRLKIERDRLLDELRADFPDASLSPLSEDGILLQNGHAAGTHWFQAGFCTIQDESSMLVGPALQVKPGMRVLDACAAPGGKTTHLAEIMGNQGEILACDVHPHKQELIKQTANRLGISIIKTMVSDAAELPDKLEGTFDRVLLDAPCTGFGVIRRKPDLKWNKTKEDGKEISKLQYHLLTQVAKLVSPGGLLVYSTCTIEDIENQEVVTRFVADHPEFQLDETLVNDMPGSVHHLMTEHSSYVQILPHHFQSDGFFIARLKRIDG